MSSGRDVREARLRLFAFFPYVLALGLGFIAQTLMWANTDPFTARAMPRVAGGIFVWFLAFTVMALGERARNIVVDGGDAPWDKPNPRVLDRVLQLSLDHLGAFIAVTGMVALLAVWLPLL